MSKQLRQKHLVIFSTQLELQNKKKRTVGQELSGHEVRPVLILTKRHRTTHKGSVCLTLLSKHQVCSCYNFGTGTSIQNMVQQFGFIYP